MDRQNLSWDEALGRLEELSRLPANWDSYDADPISKNALDRARELLLTLRAALEESLGDAFIPVNIAPIADGGVQLEWEQGGSYLEVELSTESEIGYLQAEGGKTNRRSWSGEDISIDEAVALVAGFLSVPASWTIS